MVDFVRYASEIDHRRRADLPLGDTRLSGPLWLLGVYLVVVCLSPLTIALHRRFRWWVPGLMVVGTFVADGLGFIGGQDGLRYLNVVFVLLLPHQLGHFRGDGSGDRWARTSRACRTPTRRRSASCWWASG